MMKRNTVSILSLMVVTTFSACLLPGCATKTIPPQTEASPFSFSHPLDPLDSNEIKLVRQLLLEDMKVDSTYLFYLINLREPPKSEMLAYENGDEYGREAFASVYHRVTNKTYEAIIDLKTKKVLSFTNIPGVTPGYFMGDSIAGELLKKDERWMEALKKRDIHPDSIKITVVFAGDLGIGPFDHREMICFPYYKKLDNYPIDGLAAYVDNTDNKVLKVLDDGGKGFYKPEDIGYFDAKKAKKLIAAKKPLKILQPEGKNFKVEGFQITSNEWSMRASIHNREGLVIHQVRYNDNGNWRPVIYRASMAEMYVPYGSTDLTHSAWNYYDGGAYRMGQMFTKYLTGLTHGADVPENAVYLPAILHDDTGAPLQLDSAVAVFEEYGGPLTRHGDFSIEARNLVVKYFTHIGNYDYAFKWIFREDGQIDLKAELTGVVGIKAVNRVTDAPGMEDESYNGSYYGTLVAPHVEAVNHQHFFSFRLDLDVDGTENLVEEMNTSPVPANKNNPWGNAFVMQMSLMKNEKEAKRMLNAVSNRHWMIANGNETNRLGQQKSYVLMPGHNASPMSLSGSGQRKMADFLENQFWATAYREGEYFPAGDYPNSRGIKDGLPLWIEDNETLERKDVVVWYNMGITHIVRPEDWPIMNVHTMGFSLVPFGFFDNSPVVAIGDKDKIKAVASKPLPPDVTVCVALP